MNSIFRSIRSFNIKGTNSVSDCDYFHFINKKLQSEAICFTKHTIRSIKMFFGLVTLLALSLYAITSFDMTLVMNFSKGPDWYTPLTPLFIFIEKWGLCPSTIGINAGYPWLVFWGIISVPFTLLIVVGPRYFFGFFACLSFFTKENRTS